MNQSNVEFKPLILISQEYPYGTGETFLENEIPYFTTRFRPIYIIPAFKAKTKRTLPEHVILVDSELQTDNKSVEFIRGIFSELRMFIDEWKKSPGFPFSAFLLYRIGRTLGVSKRVQNLIIEIVKKHNLENGLIYSYWMTMACVGAILAAKELNWPVVSRAHGGDLYEERYHKNYLPFQKWKIHHLDGLFPISKHGNGYLRNRYPAVDTKITTFRLGVADRGFIKRKKKSRNIFHVASCSSVIPLKRVDKIFETVFELSKVMKDVHLIWSHFGTGSEMEKLKYRVENVKSERLEVRLMGHVSNNKIISRYISEEIDLFVNYSTTEGIPVSIMEAISCGIPVAAPNIGGIPEIINEECGLLFDVDTTPKNVAKQIEVNVSAGKLYEMGQKARKQWQSQFDSDTNYKLFIEHLKTYL